MMAMSRRDPAANRLGGDDGDRHGKVLLVNRHLSFVVIRKWSQPAATTCE